MKTDLKTLNTLILSGDEKYVATWVAIVLAEEWFKDISPLPRLVINPKDRVVVKFSTISDGKKLHVEAKETIAICRRPVDADLIFYNYKE